MNRTVPCKYRKLYEKALYGKGRKAKIRMQCLECCGYDPSEVRNCTDTGCPLYKVRLTG